MLPISSRSPGGAPFLDALFTAASATCVTGLVLHDTVTYWSEFGQAVILLLIQTGGMGVVTTAVAVSLFTGKRIGLRQRCLMQEAIAAPQVGGIIRMTGFILKATFLMEAAGTLFLALRFCPEMGLFPGLWFSLFHSVSAFCNAGFDLMGAAGPFSSLTNYVGDPLVCGTIVGLIVAGGIGFFTWEDLCRHRWHLHAYRLQSKLILTITAALILLPALALYLFEFSQPRWETLTFSERLLASLFQSVTPRTAGFNTVDLTRLAGSSQMLQKRENIQCFGRRLPPATLRSAVSICTLYAVLFLTAGVLIAAWDGVPLSCALFETASAIGTVGLSLGITPELSGLSRLVLILLMYFGRVGGLAMMYALLSTSHVPAPAQLPMEKIAVG